MKALPFKLLAAMATLVISMPLDAADTMSNQAKDAQKVLSDLHQSNQKEIELARLAKEKGSTPQVRDYGDRLMKDRQEADQQVQALADKNAIPLIAPDTKGLMSGYLAKKDQDIVADLSKKVGRDFDKAFSGAMIDDHKKDISKLENAEKFLKQDDVRDFVVKLLPTLRQHLVIAQHIHKTS